MFGFSGRLASPENVMTTTAQGSIAKTWTKPELVRLGTIADVAGPNGSGALSPTQARS